MGQFALKLEKELEKNSDIYALQYHRHNETFGKGSRWSYAGENIGKFLQTERRLGEIVQREITLEVEIKRKTLEQRQKIKKELEDLKVKFFRTDFKRQRVWARFYHEMLGKALDLWRSNPLWYQPTTLTEDCATGV